MRPLRTRWKSTPGNFDPNHTLDPQWSENEWGIPEVAGVSDRVTPEWSMTFDAYRTRVRREAPLPPGKGVVTFFTEDYRFEQLWTSPDRFLGYMSATHWALTPDFSLYTDHPAAVQLWNVFRSRWLGAYWQREGLQIIPTVSWATPASYDYCFLGLPSSSVLAVSTMGVLKHADAVRLWTLGFTEMVNRLNPAQVLCCGKLPSGLVTDVPITTLMPYYAKFVE
jgi:hypothetical protein